MSAITLDRPVSTVYQIDRPWCQSSCRTAGDLPGERA